MLSIDSLRRKWGSGFYAERSPQTASSKLTYVVTTHCGMKDALAPAGIINGTLLCADVSQCPYTTIQFSPLLLVKCCRTFWVVTPLLMIHLW